MADSTEEGPTREAAAAVISSNTSRPRHPGAGGTLPPTVRRFLNKKGRRTLGGHRCRASRSEYRPLFSSLDDDDDDWGRVFGGTEPCGWPPGGGAAGWDRAAIRDGPLPPPSETTASYSSSLWLEDSVDGPQPHSPPHTPALVWVESNSDWAPSSVSPGKTPLPIIEEEVPLHVISLSPGKKPLPIIDEEASVMRLVPIIDEKGNFVPRASPGTKRVPVTDEELSVTTLVTLDDDEESVPSVGGGVRPPVPSPAGRPSPAEDSRSPLRRGGRTADNDAIAFVRREYGDERRDAAAAAAAAAGTWDEASEGAVLGSFREGRRTVDPDSSFYTDVIRSLCSVVSPQHLLLLAATNPAADATSVATALRALEGLDAWAFAVNEDRIQLFVVECNAIRALLTFLEAHTGDDRCVVGVLKVLRHCAYVGDVVGTEQMSSAVAVELFRCNAIGIFAQALEAHQNDYFPRHGCLFKTIWSILMDLVNDGLVMGDLTGPDAPAEGRARLLDAVLLCLERAGHAMSNAWMRQIMTTLYMLIQSDNHPNSPTRLMLEGRHTVSRCLQIIVANASFCEDEQVHAEAIAFFCQCIARRDTLSTSLEGGSLVRFAQDAMTSFPRNGLIQGSACLIIQRLDHCPPSQFDGDGENIFSTISAYFMKPWVLCADNKMSVT